MKKTERLARVAISITDGDHQAPPKAESGIPFLTIAAINDGQLNIDKATRFVPRTYYDSLKPERRPALGDLLFSVTGSIAIAAMVDDSRPFTFQRHIAIIKPDPSKVASRYLLHTLRTPMVKERVRSIATGTAQLTIPLGGLRNLEIPLPSLPEQKRIVAKIDSLLARSSRARDELNHISSLIERYKQALLAKAFSGELTADWRQENVSFSSSLLERAKSASGTKRPSKQTSRKLLPSVRLPSTWSSAQLEDLCSLIVDGTHFTPEYVEEGVAFISVKDIRDHEVHFDDCKFISEDTHRELSARCNPTPGDILLTKSGTIGRCAIVPEGQPFSLFVSVALIRPAIPEIISQFLLYALEYWIATIDVSQEITGTALKNLHLQDIKALEAPIPPFDEQKEILRRLTQAFNWLDKIAVNRDRAAHLLPKLEQAILTKAFRGELVPQDPNDEPASALLERIQTDRQPSEHRRGRRARV